MTPNKHDLAVHMAKLAQSVTVPRSVEDILATVTAAAVELIPGADTAGVLWIRKGGFESLGDVTDLPEKLDQLQHDWQEGPCYQAALEDTVVRTDNFRLEKRYAH